jgi:hypothetical protein
VDSLNSVLAMFQTESEKLENLIRNATTKPELTIHEIIETYYQVMNVSSMIAALKQQPDMNGHDALLSKIQEIEDVISEKFDSSIHPRTLEKLGNSIQSIMNNLQSVSSEQKSEEDIEDEAKLYEDLRQKMSTKEFVEQYGKELSG